MTLVLFFVAVLAGMLIGRAFERGAHHTRAMSNWAAQLHLAAIVSEGQS